MTAHGPSGPWAFSFSALRHRTLPAVIVPVEPGCEEGEFLGDPAEGGELDGVHPGESHPEGGWFFAERFQVVRPETLLGDLSDKGLASGLRGEIGPMVHGTRDSRIVSLLHQGVD